MGLTGDFKFEMRFFNVACMNDKNPCSISKCRKIFI
jgi:hypothetical protein